MGLEGLPHLAAMWKPIDNTEEMKRKKSDE